MVQGQELFAEDLVNHEVYAAAARNKCYQEAARHVLNQDKEKVKHLPPGSFAKSLLPFWNKLSVSANLKNQRIIVFDGYRILVPAIYKQQALDIIDVSHVGFNRAYDLCRECFHCKNMHLDIEKHCQECPQCIEFSSAMPKEPLLPDDAPPLEVFPTIACDEFSLSSHSCLLSE